MLGSLAPNRFLAPISGLAIPVLEAWILAMHGEQNPEGLSKAAAQAKLVQKHIDPKNTDAAVSLRRKRRYRVEQRGRAFLTMIVVSARILFRDGLGHANGIRLARSCQSLKKSCVQRGCCLIARILSGLPMVFR